MATSEWVPLAVACGSLVEDTRIDGEHPLDVIEAGFAAGAAWTRTTEDGREVDLGNFAAVPVTIRGPSRPVRDAANDKALALYRDRQDVDRVAAETKSNELREKLLRQSDALSAAYQRLHGKSV